MCQSQLMSSAPPSMCLGAEPPVPKPKDSSFRASHEGRGHSHGHKDRSRMRMVYKGRTPSLSLSRLGETFCMEPKEPTPLKPPRLEAEAHKEKDPLVPSVTPVPKHEDQHLPIPCSSAGPDLLLALAFFSPRTTLLLWMHWVHRT